MPLPSRLTIVYASPEKHYEGVEITQKSPQELVQDLEKRGHQEVAICGGSTIYTMFMEAGLIDTLYLTIEPVVFGSGMTLFNKPLEKHLQLESVKKLGDHTVLLEYTLLPDAQKINDR